MKPLPGTLQEGGAAFQATHWTLILRARQSDPTETARKALSDFCEAYWPPLYTFLRLRGHSRRLKRGGGHQIVSIDEHLPEAEASMMETAHLSDSRAYDLAWASNIVKRAWQHVQNAFEAEGKAESLEVLRPFVDGSGRTPPNQEEAAEKLGVPIATLRTWLWRLRQRYREALRMEVASTVSDPDDVDQELHYLYQILTA